MPSRKPQQRRPYIPQPSRDESEKSSIQAESIAAAAPPPNTPAKAETQTESVAGLP